MLSRLLLLAAWVPPASSTCELTDFHESDCNQGIASQGASWCEQDQNRLLCAGSCSDGCRRAQATTGTGTTALGVTTATPLPCINMWPSCAIDLDQDESYCDRPTADWLCTAMCADHCRPTSAPSTSSPTQAPSQVPSLPCVNFWPDCSVSSCDDVMAPWHCTAMCAEHCRPTPAPSTEPPAPAPTSMPTSMPTSVPTSVLWTWTWL